MILHVGKFWLLMLVAAANAAINSSEPGRRLMPHSQNRLAASVLDRGGISLMPTESVSGDATDTKFHVYEQGRKASLRREQFQGLGLRSVSTLQELANFVGLEDTLRKKGINLNLNLGGTVNLGTTKLHGLEANGLVDLRRTKFHGLDVEGKLDLDQAKLKGVDARGTLDFSQTKLHGVDLKGKIDFNQARLNGVDAQGKLDFSRAKLHGIDAKGKLDFSKAKLHGLDVGGTADLSQVKAHGLDVEGTAKLSSAELSGLDVQGKAAMDGVKLHGVDMQGRMALSTIKLSRFVLGKTVFDFNTGPAAAAMGALKMLVLSLSAFMGMTACLLSLLAVDKLCMGKGTDAVSSDEKTNKSKR